MCHVTLSAPRSEISAAVHLLVARLTQLPHLISMEKVNVPQKTQKDKLLHASESSKHQPNCALTLSHQHPSHTAETLIVQLPPHIPGASRNSLWMDCVEVSAPTQLASHQMEAAARGQKGIGITRATPSHTVTVTDTDVDLACGNPSTSDVGDEFLPEDSGTEGVQPAAGAGTSAAYQGE